MLWVDIKKQEEILDPQKHFSTLLTKETLKIHSPLFQWATQPQPTIADYMKQTHLQLLNFEQLNLKNSKTNIEIQTL